MKSKSKQFVLSTIACILSFSILVIAVITLFSDQRIDRVMVSLAMLFILISSIHALYSLIKKNKKDEGS